MSNGLETLAAKALVEQLNGKNFPASMSGGLVVTGISDLSLTVSVGRIETGADARLKTSISIRAVGECSPSVTASADGTGSNESECVHDAVKNYLMHVFPVFCAALGAETDSEKIDIARITSLCDGSFINWDVYLGPYLVEGSRSQDLLTEIKKQLPITLCMDSIAGYLNERRVHWVELELRRSNQSVQGFVHIDNKDDERALLALETFEWPGQANGAERFAQFIMLCPSDREVDESTQFDLEQIRAGVGSVEDILLCEDFSNLSADELKRDINILTVLLAKMAGKSQVYRARAALYGALGEIDNALDDLTIAIDLADSEEEKLDGYYRRALVHVENGNFEEAERDLQAASDCGQSDLRVVWGYAVFYLASEQFDRAREQLDRLIKENDESDYIWYYRAVCNHHSNNFEAAVADLSRAIEVNPNYLDAYFERGHIFSHLGQHERALSDYSRLLLMAPDKPEYMEARAWEYDRVGDYRSALEELARAETIAPDRPTIFELRARIMFKMGRYQECIESASAAIELLPYFAAAYDIRGEAYAKVKQARKAKKDREKADEYWLRGDQPNRCPEVDWREPESIKRVKLNQISLVDPTESLARRGSLYQELGLHEKAIEQFSKALKRDPRNSVLLQARASSYEALADWEKALADANSVIQLEGGEPGHFYNRGAIFTQRGDLEEALADFRRALELNPDHAQSYAGAGYAYMAMEDYARALPEYERALLHSPAKADWLLSKAWCLQALDRLNEAIDSLDEAIAINESFADAYYCRGFVRSRQRKRKEALEDFNYAISLISDCCDYYASRAWEHYKLGNLELSEADCRKAIELDAADPAAYDTLARLRLKQGSLDEALQFARTALANSPDYAEAHATMSLILSALGQNDEASEAHFRAIARGYIEEDDEE